MNGDYNDKLWELLGKTRRPSVSPFFSRNVLRAVRQEAETPAPVSGTRAVLFSLRRVLRSRGWQSAFAVTAVAAVVAIHPSISLRHHHTARVESGVVKQIVKTPDYETINHLDELVADEESSLWLDDSVH